MYIAMNVNAPVFVPSTGNPAADTPKLNNGLQGDQRKSQNGGYYHQRQQQQQQQQLRKSTHRGNHQQQQQQRQAQISAQKQHGRTKNDAAAYQQHKRREKQKNSAPAVSESRDTEEAAQVDKKGRVSLNHLLNFSFPARQSPMPTYTPRRSKQTNVQPFNKERFVNANFRFIVNPLGNYSVNLADPDSKLEWSDIEQVLIIDSETPSCPICLSTPAAGRVTKCGHIFCMSCIMHYLTLRDNPKKQWRKCPICWDSVYEKDLKSVRVLHPYAVLDPSGNVNRVKEGNAVELSLMQRSSNSTLAFPVSESWPIPDDVIHAYLKPGVPLTPWYFMPHALQFAKFMLASPEYLQSEYSRDKDELIQGIVEAKEWGLADEIPFLETSLDIIHGKLKELKLQHTMEIDLAMRTSKLILDAVKNDRPVAGSSSSTVTSDKIMEEQQQEVPMAYQQLHQDHDKSSFADGTESVSSTQVANSKGPKSDFYFFQAADGQHIYLHPLDIRVLKHEFGDYRNFPMSMNVVAEAVEETTLTEDLRKRVKYLGHLPLACDVTFLEIDLKNHVSQQTLKVFENELNARVKKRRDRAKREERMRKAVEAKQKRKEANERNDAARQAIENDPFFQVYRPISAEENEAMLARAIDESSREARQSQQQQQQQSGPKTVWGTPAVASQDDTQREPAEWADHILVTTAKRKNKKKSRK